MKVVLSMRIQKELSEKLERKAKDLRRTKTSIVEEALEQFFEEKGERKMTKYEIVKNTLETKGDYEQGMTYNYEGDQYPEILASYDTLKEAKEALKDYTSEIRDMSGYNLITEYYIEENAYDEEGEWISGGDVWEFAPVLTLDMMEDIAREVTEDFFDEFESDHEAEVDRQTRYRYAEAAIATIDYENEKDMTPTEFYKHYMEWTKEAEDELVRRLEEGETL